MDPIHRLMTLLLSLKPHRGEYLAVRVDGVLKSHVG